MRHKAVKLLGSQPAVTDNVVLSRKTNVNEVFVKEFCPNTSHEDEPLIQVLIEQNSAHDSYLDFVLARRRRNYDCCFAKLYIAYAKNTYGLAVIWLVL